MSSTSTLTRTTTLDTIGPHSGGDIQIHINEAIDPHGRAVFEPSAAGLDSKGIDTSEEIAPWLSPDESPKSTPAASSGLSSKFSFPSMSKPSWPSGSLRSHKGVNDSVTSFSSSEPYQQSRHKNHSNLSVSISQASDSHASSSPQSLSPSLHPPPSPDHRSRGSLLKKASKLSLLKKRSRSRLGESPRNSEDSVPPLPTNEFGMMASGSNLTLPLQQPYAESTLTSTKSKREKKGSGSKNFIPRLKSSSSSTPLNSSIDGSPSSSGAPNSSSSPSDQKKDWETGGQLYDFDHNLDDISSFIDVSKLPQSTTVDGDLKSRGSTTSLQTTGYSGLSLNGQNSSMSSMRTTDIDEFSSLSPSDTQSVSRRTHARSSSNESYGIPVSIPVRWNDPWTSSSSASSSRQPTHNFDPNSRSSLESFSGSSTHAHIRPANGSSSSHSNYMSRIAQLAGRKVSPKSSIAPRDFGSIGSVASDATITTPSSSVLSSSVPLSTASSSFTSNAGLSGAQEFDAAWYAPDSWVVDPPKNQRPMEEVYSSDEEDPLGAPNSAPPNGKGEVGPPVPPKKDVKDGSGRRKRKKTPTEGMLPKNPFLAAHPGALHPPSMWELTPGLPHSPSIGPSSSGGSGGGGAGGRRGSSSKAFPIRVYREDGGYHMATLPLNTTVDDLVPFLNQRLLLDEGAEAHRLYIKERGRERVLAQTEKPAVIARRRMHQAGYDFSDGQELLSGEGLNFLLRFVYKTQLLGGVEQERDFKLEDYESIDLTSRGLRTIPVSLHRSAEAIVSLTLSKNPMLDIPLDFIQSCTSLRYLRLSHMAMKKVPPSLRHCLTLYWLDVSCNRIADLDETYFDHIPTLTTLFMQNNRIEKLPWHFPRLRSLRTLNISNNKFTELPSVITELESLQHLDISFNMISELPEDIGRLTSLERFFLVGNQVSRFPNSAGNLLKLKILNCRRNQIGDLGVVCTLPELEFLNAEYNNVASLDMSVGPHLTELSMSHNDITKLTFLHGPVGPGEGAPSYALTTLDISHAKLSSLDDIALSRLSGLKTLKVSHNMFVSIPESVGELQELETLSCSNNRLESLPASIGRLQKLVTLDAHNNDIQEIPMTLWNCGALRTLNLTSNLLQQWPETPLAPVSSPPSANGISSPAHVISSSDAALSAERKSSAASITSSSRTLPPLAHSLERLYLGENHLTDEGLIMLTVLRELRVLNLSFNGLQDLPPPLFKTLTNLEELYLSGNKLTNLPAEDLYKMQRLTTLFLNGNKLHTLPQELGKIRHLTVLDVGSNVLKYNINNWEFDWNWNFNKNLKYLNLSGNDRLQIKDAPKGSIYRHSRDVSNLATLVETKASLSGFSNLKQLRVLGLMDVTIATTGNAVDIPEENDQRRVRTSMSIINGMTYGIADTLGKNQQLNMLDLVHEFRDRPGEAIFAMFGRAQPPKHAPAGASTNRLAKFLHDNFLTTFLGFLDSRSYDRRKQEDVTDALRRSFLKLNHTLHDYLSITHRKGSVSSTGEAPVDPTVARSGASGVVVYVSGTRLYIANAGNALAVISRAGIAESLTTHHVPEDRKEISRIREAEGWISHNGLISEELDLSRSFGFYHLMPFVNARPDIRIRDLSESDEFIIIGNRGLWDFVSYQTAVDIARQEFERPGERARRADLAAQKLRDFALSYGAEGSTMIMVIGVADLFNNGFGRMRQGTADSMDSSILPTIPRAPKKVTTIADRQIARLPEELEPPTGHVTLVFTDIRNSTPLWEANPGMPTAMKLHNSLLRRHLRLCGGFEVKTEGDAFMCSFSTTLAALRWCLIVQLHLLDQQWPLEILECDDGKEVFDDEGQLIARGLSVRMGIHCGEPLCERDPNTRRMDYFGPMVNRTARIEANARGGQIACSTEIVREIKAKILGTEPPTPYSDAQPASAVEAISEMGIEIMEIGEVKLKGLETTEVLSVVYPKALKGRHLLGERQVDEEMTTSGSRVQFSVAQMQELGCLCLRLESLATNRIFRTFPTSRKDSIQSSSPPPEEDELEHSDSNIIYGDPIALLPQMSDKSSDAELMMLLDSFSIRIDNALASIQRLHGHSEEPPKFDKEQFVFSLVQRGIQAPALREILSVLQEFA